jgi:hypothetical protein
MYLFSAQKNRSGSGTGEWGFPVKSLINCENPSKGAILTMNTLTATRLKNLTGSRLGHVN